MISLRRRKYRWKVSNKIRDSRAAITALSISGSHFYELPKHSRTKESANARFTVGRITREKFCVGLGELGKFQAEPIVLYVSCSSSCFPVGGASAGDTDEPRGKRTT